ncbi:TonB-dependent receptor [Sphingomonas lenta]|uniref:TonB-dependent receptor n=1 Tax=Sphingomonas lenta TaxID=1141887 RepID=A0A2A2SEL2_9SPHN|nr:TonB-dependent receptor [Sphingomonas lenta]PAX07696.1 TonB-dependent receptor [Sphingomonas lenta]
MRNIKHAATLLASSALASPAFAQDVSPPTNEPPVEAGAPSEQTQDGAPVTGEGTDIVVTGIRASQARAIDIKRNSDAIVDAISAQDIGKLPDVTIVDSIQRIPGVQIQRSAGEGATANIRGLPQVVTLLNGEQYLSPANLGTAQPNLNDIPAQLLGGVVVYKSQDLRNAVSGVSGTIDLRTRRPFDFQDGLTLSGQAEYHTGEDTRQDDYLVSGLASYRRGRFGALVTAAYSDFTLGNNYAGFGGGQFLNNDWGGNGPNWVAPHGYETFHREVERQRLGVSGAVQWEVDDGVTLTGEGFYTRFIEHDLRAGMNISNRWTGLGWTNPTSFNDTGLPGRPNGQTVYDVDAYALDAWWVNSFSINRSIKSESKNFNLALDWDKGGPFTFSVRGIYADADYLNTNGQVQGDLSNWRQSTADGSTDHTFTLFRNSADPTRGPFYPANIASQYAGRFTNGVVGSRGGRYVDPNPLGYARDPQLNIDVSGRNSIVWSGFDRPIGGGLGPNATLRDYMANLNSYTVAAYSSEGNNRNKSDIYAFRFDGAYDYSKEGELAGGFIKRVDIGARASRRRTEISVYHLFSRLYAGNGASDPNGCAVQWKAIDVVLDNFAGCTAGEQVPNPSFNPALPVSATNPQTVFQGYTANRPTNLAANNNTYFLEDFGSVTKGFPGVWVADPRDFNDPLAFQERVFGNAFPVIIPGSTYDVNFYEQMGYANLNMEFGPDIVANAGIKMIRTKLKVRQNVTGPTIPYGDTNEDLGDFFDDRTYIDFLPTVNVQWNVTDNLRLRAAFAETMIPLDLGNYGGGLTIATNDSPGGPGRAPIGVREATSANSSGNPNLNPWRSKNYDLAVEYYVGRASLLNVGAFRLDIDSFVTTQTLNDGAFPDSDGVIRRTNLPFTRPIQGEGGKVQGVEVAAKLALSDFLQTDSFVRNFGLDANYTYADSSRGDADVQRNGDDFPFFDNSKHIYNAALFYDDGRLQARIAYNRRSPRLTGQVQDIPIFQDTTEYVDANITFAVTPNISVYANGSNIFGEIERYYYQFDNDARQLSHLNEFEPRYSAGVRFRF